MAEESKLWNAVLNENIVLRRQVSEMEDFLEDHGLVWVGTGAPRHRCQYFLSQTFHLGKENTTVGVEDLTHSRRGHSYARPPTWPDIGVCVVDSGHQIGKKTMLLRLSQPLFCLCTWSFPLDFDIFPGLSIALQVHARAAKRFENAPLLST